MRPNRRVCGGLRSLCRFSTPQQQPKDPGTQGPRDPRTQGPGQMTEEQPLRVVIVDDEPLARGVVREFAMRQPGVVVIAECANGFEAVKAVSELNPDLLFLDVQMPKLDGFEVLELLGRSVPVIFTTAYDKYALRAFEVHAIDYLMKPFSEERFAEALTRARTRLLRRDEMPVEDLLSEA